MHSLIRIVSPAVLAVLALASASAAAQRTAVPPAPRITAVLCDGSPCAEPLLLFQDRTTNIELQGENLDLVEAGSITGSSEIAVRLGRPLSGTRSVLLTPGTGTEGLTGLRLILTTTAGQTLDTHLDLAVAGRTTTQVGRTFVMRVTPDPILLDPDGTFSGRITIEGQALDQLDGGQVEASGTAVDGLVVSFLPGGVTRRELTLGPAPATRSLSIDRSVGATVAPIANEPMQLVLRTASGTPVASPATVLLRAPDLIVAGVQVGSAQQEHIDVTYTLRNAGMADFAGTAGPWISGSPGQFRLPGAAVDGSGRITIGGSEPVLIRAGGSLTRIGRLDYASLPDPGTYEYAAFAPARWTVPTSNAGPREMRFTVTVPPPARVDLVIAQAFLNKSPIVHGQAVPAQLYVDVRNEGAHRDEWRTFTIEAPDCSFLQAEPGYTDQGPTTVRRSFRVAFTDLPVRTYTCTLRIDYGVAGYWREGNTSNNETTVSIPVTGR